MYVANSTAFNFIECGVGLILFVLKLKSLMQFLLFCGIKKGVQEWPDKNSNGFS